MMEFSNVCFLKQANYRSCFISLINFEMGKTTLYFTELCIIVPFFGTCLTFHQVEIIFLATVIKGTSRLHQRCNVNSFEDSNCRWKTCYKAKCLPKLDLLVM